MSCLKLPKVTCNRLSACIRKFSWGNKANPDKQQVINWEKRSLLCKHKSHGGMGCRDLTSFNRALLAKQAWKLLHNHSSIFTLYFKAMYHPHLRHHFWNLILGSFILGKRSSKSWVWLVQFEPQLTFGMITGWKGTHILSHIVCPPVRLILTFN